MYGHARLYEGRRRVKSKNFSDRELNVLLELVTKYTVHIENKRTDTNSCRNKTLAWDNIAGEYNSLIGLDPYRSAQQLRTCYDNIKRRLRRELAEDKLKRSSDNHYVRTLSESSERLLKLLTDFHKNKHDAENSHWRNQNDDPLFLIEEDTELHEQELSQFTQSEEDEINQNASDTLPNKRKRDDEAYKRKRDRVTVSDVYDNLNEVLNTRRRKTCEEEAFVKKRWAVMVETEEINLKNARMQARILENNLRVSELELQIKEKMLKSLDT